MRIPDIPTHWIWWTLTIIFGIISIISGLGEYVFHWWDQPWDVGTPLSVVATVLTFVWGASARDLRATRGELREGFSSVREGQSEQTELLCELRLSQSEQNHLTRANTTALAELRTGQAEGNALLREMVASFRRPP